MSAIHDLISQIDDPRLRARLTTEWASASQDKKFGLVFEDHLPELLPLYKARPRRGDLVCRRDGPLTEVWQVRRISDGFAFCVKPKFEAGTAKAPSEKDSAAEQFKLPVGIDAGDFSRVRNADFRRISVERLMTMINGLGSRVEVVATLRRSEARHAAPAP